MVWKTIDSAPTEKPLYVASHKDGWRGVGVYRKTVVGYQSLQQGGWEILWREQVARPTRPEGFGQIMPTHWDDLPALPKAP